MANQASKNKSLADAIGSGKMPAIAHSKIPKDKNMSRAIPSKHSEGDTPLLNKKANAQAKKILKALDQANEIHSGRKKGTSFNEFLKEI